MIKKVFKIDRFNKYTIKFSVSNGKYLKIYITDDMFDTSDYALINIDNFCLKNIKSYDDSSAKYVKNVLNICQFDDNKLREILVSLNVA